METKRPHDTLPQNSINRIYDAEESDEKLAAILQLELMGRVQDMANLKYKFFAITAASKSGN